MNVKQVHYKVHKTFSSIQKPYLLFRTWNGCGSSVHLLEINYKRVENGILKMKFELSSKYKGVKNGVPKWNLNKAKLQVHESIPSCSHPSKAKKRRKKEGNIL